MQLSNSSVKIYSPYNLLGDPKSAGVSHQIFTRREARSPTTNFPGSEYIKGTVGSNTYTANLLYERNFLENKGRIYLVCNRSGCYLFDGDRYYTLGMYQLDKN